jgi:hypothetical protein
VSEVNARLEEAAERFHLAAHLVSNVIIHSAGDVEVHRGRDNNYYMLDLARCFPPEHFGQAMNFNEFSTMWRSCVFFRMLRPELLSHFRKEGCIPPVSPDALSGWGRQDSVYFNRVSALATDYLLRVRIPQLADSLLTRKEHVSISTWEM